MLRTPSCCTSARTELSVSPEPTRSIITASPRRSRIAAARTTCSSPCNGMKLAYTNTRKSWWATSGSGSHHVVVGTDPQAAELGPRCGEVHREMLGVSIGVDQHPVRQSARQAVLEFEPLRLDPATRRLAVLGRLLERHERVEQHRRAPQPGDRLRGGDVGVAGEADEHEVGRPMPGRGARSAGVRRAYGLGSETTRTSAPARRSALATIRFREYPGSK